MGNRLDRFYLEKLPYFSVALLCSFCVSKNARDRCCNGAAMMPLSHESYSPLLLCVDCCLILCIGQDMASSCFMAIYFIWTWFGPWFNPQTGDLVSILKIILTCSTLQCFNFEERLNKVLNEFLILAIHQFNLILQIWHNLLSDSFISQGCHGGMHSLVVAPTTTIIKGVHAFKK